MADRSSRPRSSPTKTPPALVKQIVKARLRRRLGPARIAAKHGDVDRPCKKFLDTSTKA
ncbi:hypothetical protein C5C86_05895 [Rathayibacter sp. AY1E4]|nr:hypothetical protein C5C86_05895 [Rathayibacter sp. AY1E4]